MSDTNVVDDEAWLYGDSNPETEDKVFNEEKPEEIENIAIAFGENGEIEKPAEQNVPTLPKDPDDTANSNKGSESDSDDDDDDEVQVTIGEIKDTTSTFPTYGAAPVNFNLKRGAVPSVIKPKGLDPETVGNINGINLYDFNLDSLEEKPWRKPGSDITDYFNYGFNEDTWKIYCEKQKKLRTENNVQIKLVPSSPKDNLIAITAVNENSKYALPGQQQGLLKKAGPPPGRKMSGSIDVIGGGAPSLPSRRPGTQRENVIQVMTGRTFDVSAGMPPLHLPPPSHHHFQRSFMPDLSMPPPVMPPNVMPPTLIGSVPPPYQDVYEGYPVSHPPPSMDDQVNYFNGSNASYEDNFRQGSPRDSDSKRDRDRRNYSSSYEVGEEYEHKRHREKDRDHHYDREERYDRDRDRDRDRERERERRHRDHREKEERTRSSRRRHHHDDDDHRASRHKHKRSRREKEESNNSSHPENSTSKTVSSDHTPVTDGASKGAGDEGDQ